MIPGCAGPAVETPRRPLRIQQARYAPSPPSYHFDALAVMTVSDAWTAWGTPHTLVQPSKS